jgi:hypothetical protein
MPDSRQVFAPAAFIPYSNGDPVSGAKINVYDAGTTDAQTVYSDSALATALPNPIICDAAGMPTTNGTTLTEVYVGTAAFKVVITDSADVTLYTFDNIQGALDTSSFSGAGSGTYARPVISKSADYSVVSGDAGDIIQANPTGGTFTITLPSAVTVGDGFAVGIRHNGTANEVRVATVSSQTIDIPGANSAGGVGLVGLGHMVELVSDGANWIGDITSPPLIAPDTGLIKITDRLTAPPSSPDAGARYIINGTPTGDWSARSEHDIAEADGQGGWIYYTPPASCGWLAWVVDETLYSSFQSSSWVDQTGMSGAQSSILKSALFQYQQSNGTNGGTPTATTDTRYPLNTFVNSGDANVITGASIASEVITLPQGTYRFKAEAQIHNGGYCQIGIKNVTDSTTVWGPVAFLDSAGSPGMVKPTITRDLVVDGATETFEMRYFISNSETNTGLGTPSSFSNGVEIYGECLIEDLTALQGADGAQGPQGAAGAAGATGATGATGAAGQVIVDYTFDSASTADSDPGSGNIRANNATPASVTAFYIDDLDRLGVDQSVPIAAWDDSTSTGTKAWMYIEDLTSGNRWTYALTAASDSSGYWELTVSHQAGTGAFASNNVSIVIIPRGDAGSGLADLVDDMTPQLGGDLDTNSFNIQFDDAHGIHDDSDNEQLVFQKTASAVNHVEVTNAATGNDPSIAAAGDDTNIDLSLSGKGSGKVLLGLSGSAVQKADGNGGLEGAAATDLGAGKHTLWVPAVAMTARTTNGAASGSNELATNDIMVASFDFDQTTEEGVGFWLALPKSWNLGTVTFQPFWTAGSGTGGVVWGLAAYAFSDNDALDTAVSGQQTSTDTFITANDCHVGPESSAITIGGTPADDDLLYFEVTREVGNGSDTLTADAQLIGIKLFATTDAINDS